MPKFKTLSNVVNPKGRDRGKDEPAVFKPGTVIDLTDAQAKPILRHLERVAAAPKAAAPADPKPPANPKPPAQ